MPSNPVFAARPLQVGNLDELSILLVEDNDVDADLIVRALRRGRLVNIVHRTRDGIEALEFLAADRGDLTSGASLPSLIFLDLQMPRMDGPEFLRRLKLDERLKRIPVTIFASSIEDLDMAQAYRLGADSYIVKPPNFDAFSNAVCEAALYWLVMKRNTP